MIVDISKLNGLCSCGHVHEISVKKIVIESQATKYLREYMNDYKKPVFLCDSNTKAAAKKSMGTYFDEYEVLELEGNNIHADNIHVDTVESKLAKDADILVAVGSGTIHDLTRYIAFNLKIPFISVPTAASVDGYVSTVAAMTWYGLKKTMAAVSPLYVIADTDIFSVAPYRLTASGISDLMGKYTALLDWRVSSLVCDEYLCERIYDLELEAVHEVEAVLDKIKLQDKESMEKLMYALILSGLAMQMIGNSRPASGAEHHIAHLWEMEVINEKLDALHGEKVSIGLILCLEYYKKVKQAIESDNCSIHNHIEFETKLLEASFGKKGIYSGILEENGQNVLEDINPEKLKNMLPFIAMELEKLPSARDMKDILSHAGCVTDMEQIGIDVSQKELTLQLCPYVRRRLTLLRLSKMLMF